MRVNTNITLSSVVKPFNQEEIKVLFHDKSRIQEANERLELIVRELFSDAEDVTITFSLQEEE